MTNLEWCIDYLKKYNRINRDFGLTEKDNFRGLMNITMPYNLSEEFYSKQDEVIKEILSTKKITDCNDLKMLTDKICLYLGDITLIKADAIVNACNSRLLGCFQPLHLCVDNAIHSFAGLQVRRDLMPVMEKQGHEEPAGCAKITKAYNLPSKYIIHTVGPIVYVRVHDDDRQELYSSYISSLTLADQYNLSSIVFSSISTGLYGYPINEASIVALDAVKDYFEKNKNSNIKRVVFNLFKEDDYNVYLKNIKEYYRQR